MGTADDFRKNAEECRQFAERAIKPTTRARWLTLAGNWLKLAETAEATHTKGRHDYLHRFFGK